MKSFFQAFGLFSFLFAGSCIFIRLYSGRGCGDPQSGRNWCLMLFFVCLAVAFRGHKFLRGFLFTVIILAVVSLALYYPLSIF